MVEGFLRMFLNPNLGGLFKGSFWGGRGGSKTRQNYARILKFGTQVHTHMQIQKIYFSVPRLS